VCAKDTWIREPSKNSNVNSSDMREEIEKWWIKDKGRGNPCEGIRDKADNRRWVNIRPWEGGKGRTDYSLGMMGGVKYGRGREARERRALGTGWG